jgi:hypothetical protein
MAGDRRVPKLRGERSRARVQYEKSVKVCFGLRARLQAKQANRWWRFFDLERAAQESSMSDPRETMELIVRMTRALEETVLEAGSQLAVAMMRALTDADEKALVAIAAAAECDESARVEHSCRIGLAIIHTRR